MYSSTTNMYSSTTSMYCSTTPSTTEPSVHEGVAAGRGHGEDVEAEEGEVVVWPAVQGELNVLQQVDEVEGQPADDEHQQHGQQHSVPGSE